MLRTCALVASLGLWILRAACIAEGAVQAPARGEEPPNRITLLVDPANAVREIDSSSNVRTFKSSFRGHVHLWASSTELDPILRVGDDHEAPVAEDDNSGGGTTAYLSIAVEPGQVLRIRVDGAKEPSRGVARLSIRELPETDATTAAVSASRSALAEIAAMSTEAKPELVRARLTRTVDDLLATPGAGTSEAVQEALRSVSDVVRARLDDPDAERIHRALLAFVEPNYPPDCMRVQHDKILLVVALTAVGKASEALPIGLAVIATLERTLAADDVEIQLARGATADVYTALQQFERARDMYRAIMAAFDRVLPESDIRRADVRSNLAFALYQLGELEEARGLEEEALETYRRMLPENDPYRIGEENNLASTLNALGDKQAALVLHRHVLEVYLRTLPADHVEIIGARMNVGLGLYAIGDLAAAQELLEQALEGYAAHFSEDHPKVEQARLNLAFVLDKQAKYEPALALVQKTLDLHREPLDRAPVRFWRTLAELVILREHMGDLRGARDAAEATVAIMSRCYAADSPHVIEQEIAIARLLFRLEKAEEARQLLLATAGKMQRFFADCATSMPTRQAEAVEANWSRLSSVSLSLLAAPAMGGRERQNLECAFALIESARGIGTNALRCARVLGFGEHRAAVDAKRALVRDASARLARLASESGATAELEEAVRAKEHAEREMRAAIAAELGAEVALPVVDAKTVSAALREGEVAIGYWIYAQRAPSSGVEAVLAPSMLAMVLRRDGSLARVELGPLAAIEAASASWRRAIADAATGKKDAATRETGERLRKLVVDPLRESAGSARRWIVALDGALHLVPLDALPEGEGCLGDRVEVDVRPVLWDLARSRARTAGDSTLLALGGIDYDAEIEVEAPASEARPERSASRSVTRDPAATRFEPLPDTAREVTAIAALFRDAHGKDARADVLMESAASKEQLLARAPQARFLHLATHGCFAAGSSARAREDVVFDGGRVPGDALSFEGELREFAPLTLCGLAMAGANRSGALGRATRALITAEELGTLDLSRCELGVLSACDTNLGERIAGQGIASFQKALHAAGARTVITSLWKVPDQATHDLMVEFYRNIWIERLPKSQALWKAKQALRMRRAPVRDWAGWVLSGEPD